VNNVEGHQSLDALVECCATPSGVGLLVEHGAPALLVSLLRGTRTDPRVALVLRVMSATFAAQLLNLGADAAAVRWLADGGINTRHACWVDVCHLLMNLALSGDARVSARPDTVLVLTKRLQDGDVVAGRAYLVAALSSLASHSTSRVVMWSAPSAGALVLFNELLREWHWLDVGYDGALYDGVAWLATGTPERVPREVFLCLVALIRLRVRYECAAGLVREAIVAKSYGALAEALALVTAASVSTMCAEAARDDLSDEAVPEPPLGQGALPFEAVRAAVGHGLPFHVDDAPDDVNDALVQRWPIGERTPLAAPTLSVGTGAVRDLVRAAAVSRVRGKRTVDALCRAVARCHTSDTLSSHEHAALAALACAERRFDSFDARDAAEELRGAMATRERRLPDA